MHEVYKKIWNVADKTGRVFHLQTDHGFCFTAQHCGQL